METGVSFQRSMMIHETNVAYFEQERFGDQPMDSGEKYSSNPPTIAGSIKMLHGNTN